MPTISVKLLGPPNAAMNGKPVSFPFKKAEALFYYLVTEKTVYRNQISALLWEDTPDSNAKKNLRNALYSLKNAFLPDIYSAPNRNLLIINPDITLHSDLDKFLESSNPSFYSGDFLQDFSIKGSLSFNEWITQKRLQYKTGYLSNLLTYIINCSHENPDELEKQVHRYLAEDAFDERPYFVLMSAYQEAGIPEKGIELYQQLYSLLNSELGINPNQEITQLYYQLLADASASSVSSSVIQTSDILGHESVTLTLRKQYDIFFPDHSSHNIIMGENGIGKSYLVEQFLQQLDLSNTLFLSVLCLQAEKTYALQSINTILMDLEDYIISSSDSLNDGDKLAVARLFPALSLVTSLPSSLSLGYRDTSVYQQGKEGLMHILQEIAKTTPILLYFDNLQAMDSLSFDIWATIISSEITGIMSISTCVDSTESFTLQTITSLIENGYLNRFDLEHFTFDNVKQYAAASIAPDIPEDKLRSIYEEADGNTFFLMEMLQKLKEQLNDSKSDAKCPPPFSSHAENTLNDRLNGITPDARQLLDILALFHNHVSVELLTIFLNRSSKQIANILEELKSHALIKEHLDNGIIKYSFCHNKMQEFIYNKLSPLRQKVLHHHAGESLEILYENREYSDHKNLIYHFTLGQDNAKAIYYYVRDFEDYITINYVLYPTYPAGNPDNEFSKDNILTYFSFLETSILNIKLLDPSFTILDEAQARLLYAKCCYYLSNGMYLEFETASKAALQSTFVKTNNQFRLNILQQRISHGIQIYDTKRMHSCINEGLSLLYTMDDKQKLSLYQRLNGLCILMDGQDINHAITELEQSIKTIPEDTNPSFSANISAAYNYLGECMRLLGNYDEACYYYNQALETSAVPAYSNGYTATFYCNMGRALLELKHLDKAEKMFDRSYHEFQNSNAIMRRSITCSYLACFRLISNDLTAVTKYLTDAHKASVILKSPEELFILYHIIAKIASIRPDAIPEELQMPVQHYHALEEAYGEKLPKLQKSHILQADFL